MLHTQASILEYMCVHMVHDVCVILITAMGRFESQKNKYVYANSLKGLHLREPIISTKALL